MGRLDLSKPFVLYIHGYEEHPSNESCQTIVSAYLRRGTDNIVLLDWSSLAFDNYITVYFRIKDIARHTAEAVKNLVLGGLSVDTLHIVGHSMGGQVAGFIGQYLDFVLPRVTGLDPANPLFYHFGADHISEKSARQVDIIHTDGGLYGAFERTGRTDFFPNGGGRPQPGCHLIGLPLSPKDLCSHWRSWRYYAESVVHNEAFPALACNSLASFQQGLCDNNNIVHMGYAMPKNTSGTFFLTTTNASPFGKGINGVRRKE
ncbi:pancreatic triacylglycerol lipase isoform X2 [Copidosoma floridanum]|nr:pancreatic triacylglycerol lipase isoform X2 [Copidosoma floridanum]